MDSPAPAHLNHGSVFAGDFRIVRPLKAGGMGAVYVAEQLSTGKERALKFMLPQLVADPKLRQRFEQEARIGSKIASEHVVEVVAAGIDTATGSPWLAMELLRGEDLATRVSRAGALPPPMVYEIMEQLCHAVGAAHSVGIVHRDLKPENVFLAEARRAGSSSVVKVLDFGIAKIAAEAETAGTAAVGSPLWMAPEQTTAGSAISPGTDVWALGLIAFHLFTGRHYWRSGEDEKATMAMLLREIVLDPLVAPSTRASQWDAPRLPSGFDDWFARCVSRERTSRFADAAEAFRALAGLAASSSTSPPLAVRSTALENAPTVAATGNVSPPRRAGRRRYLIWAAAGLVLGLAAAIGGWGRLRDHDRPYDEWDAFASHLGPILAPTDLTVPISTLGKPLESWPVNATNRPTSFEGLVQVLAEHPRRSDVVPWTTTEVTLSRTKLHVPAADLVLPIPADADHHGFEERLKRGSRSDFLITPLYRSMQWVHDHWKRLALARGDDPAGYAVALVVDRDVPYRALAEVFFTLGQVGISRYYLAVRHGADLFGVEQHIPANGQLPHDATKLALGLKMAVVKDGFLVFALGQRVGAGCGGRERARPSVETRRRATSTTPL